MPNTKAKPMMEGGLLAALLVVIAVMSLYIPFANVVWSLPVALIGARHGVRYSVLTAVVGALLIALTVHLAEGVMLFLGGGLTGIVLGACLARRLGGVKTLALTSVSSFVSLIVFIELTMVMMGVDLAGMIEQIQMSSASMVQDMAGMMSTEAEREAFVQMEKELMQMVVMLLPSGLVMYALVCAGVNLMLARAIMRRMQMEVSYFPPFARWRFSRAVLYLFVLSLVGVYWGDKWNSDILISAAENVKSIMMWALLLQGASVLWFVKEKSVLIGRIWWLVFLLAVISPIFTIALVVLGGVDILMNYRKIGEKQV